MWFPYLRTFYPVIWQTPDSLETGIGLDARTLPIQLTFIKFIYSTYLLNLPSPCLIFPINFPRNSRYQASMLPQHDPGPIQCASPPQYRQARPPLQRAAFAVMMGESSMRLHGTALACRTLDIANATSQKNKKRRRRRRRRRRKPSQVAPCDRKHATASQQLAIRFHARAAVYGRHHHTYSVPVVVVVVVVASGSALVSTRLATNPSLDEKTAVHPECISFASKRFDRWHAEHSEHLSVTSWHPLC